MQGRGRGNVAAERLCGALFVGLMTLKGYFYTNLGGTLVRKLTTRLGAQPIRAPRFRRPICSRFERAEPVLISTLRRRFKGCWPPPRTFHIASAIEVANVLRANEACRLNEQRSIQETKPQKSRLPTKVVSGSGRQLSLLLSDAPVCYITRILFRLPSEQRYPSKLLGSRVTRTCRSLTPNESSNRLFVLMFLTPLAWILIARQREWGYWRKGIVALGALVPLSIAAVMLSLMLNGAVAALKLR